MFTVQLGHIHPGLRRGGRVAVTGVFDHFSPERGRDVLDVVDLSGGVRRAEHGFEQGQSDQQAGAHDTGPPRQARPNVNVLDHVLDHRGRAPAEVQPEILQVPNLFGDRVDVEGRQIGNVGPLRGDIWEIRRGRRSAAGRGGGRGRVEARGRHAGDGPGGTERRGGIQRPMKPSDPN